jgi:hypothetical protein
MRQYLVGWSFMLMGHDVQVSRPNSIVDCFHLDAATQHGSRVSSSHCYDAKDGRMWAVMGNSQGRDNVRKRARRRKKMKRLALAKTGKQKAEK